MPSSSHAARGERMAKAGGRFIPAAEAGADWVTLRSIPVRHGRYDIGDVLAGAKSTLQLGLSVTKIQSPGCRRTPAQSCSSTLTELMPDRSPSSLAFQAEERRLSRNDPELSRPRSIKRNNSTIAARALQAQQVANAEVLC